MPFLTETRTRSGLSLDAGAFERQRAHDDAIGALALLAHLDEARDGDVAGRPRQHRMRDLHGLQRRHRKARRDGRAGRARWGTPTGRCRARNAITQHASGETRARPPGRLAVGGEIDRDAEAERDRQPRQQAARAGVGDDPVVRDCSAATAEAWNARPAQASARRRRSAASHVPTRPPAPGPCPNPPCATPPRAQLCRSTILPGSRPEVSSCRRPPWRMYHAIRRCD